MTVDLQMLISVGSLIAMLSAVVISSVRIGRSIQALTGRFDLTDARHGEMARAHDRLEAEVRQAQRDRDRMELEIGKIRDRVLALEIELRARAKRQDRARSRLVNDTPTIE